MSWAGINYYERYQEIIDAYNGEQDRAVIEKTFVDLMNLASEMDQETQRYVREGFANDEELAIYDLLFSEQLSKQDIKAIKEASVYLLRKVKEKIAELDHWTDKEETTSVINVLIRNTLFEKLPISCVPDIRTYTEKVYAFVYEHYQQAA